MNQCHNVGCAMIPYALCSDFYDFLIPNPTVLNCSHLPRTHCLSNRAASSSVRQRGLNSVVRVEDCYRQ